MLNADAGPNDPRVVVRAGDDVEGGNNGAVAMGSIPARGISQKTIEGQVNNKKNFCIFLVYQNGKDSYWPADIHELTSVHANDQALYERYAYYLTFTCQNSRCGAYLLGTIKNLVRGSAQLMKQIFNEPGTLLYKVCSSPRPVSQRTRTWIGRGRGWTQTWL